MRTSYSNMFGAAFVALAAMCATAHQAQAGTPTVNVSEGALSGLSTDGVAQFRGIPYALPPTGEQRWRPPQAPRPWTGVRDATRFGSTCPQAATHFGPATLNEDCLTLNVYAPEAPSARPRPVLFYIHGGGFIDGSGSYYDASVLARKADALVVTLNYRLGVFGFLTTTGMAGEGKALNFGLQDQYAALDWVKRNIAAFGGDPARVTVAGQSAGGASVCLAMTSPKAAGLFHGAIMHSAPCTMALAPLDKARGKGDAIASKVGCAPGPLQMACLRGKTTVELMQAVAFTSPQDILLNAIWPATIDGTVIPSATLAALSRGQFNKVPTMIGTMQDEGRGLLGWGFHVPVGREVTQTEYETTFKALAGDMAGGIVTSFYPASKYGSVSKAMAVAFTDVGLACPAHNVSQALAGHVPTYAFEFADKHAPQFFPDPFFADGWGAYHMGELRYVFQKPVSGMNFPGLNDAQQALSEQWIGYWRNFIATGDPNSDGAGAPPAWPAYASEGRKHVQSLKPEGITTLSDGQYQTAHKCLLWSSYYGLGALFGMY